MYFKKNEVINHRLSKKPRISYAYAAEFVRKLNIILSSAALLIMGASAYSFLTEVHFDREAYFVKSSGEFKLINYSKETKEKAMKIFYENGNK